ncbi:baculoviral IAP repeat-containing protein 7-A-like [Mytilus californianus]|uniref:baculoviral IAP repeat-containing protein 7-A-like n=1 Tax=Mytilus californianus TaxID=6549 RepID=UPI002245705F|nr:baculoviral IAP repeat-containing protein 7-A-like [Mytilus californianus]
MTVYSKLMASDEYFNTFNSEDYSCDPKCDRLLGAEVNCSLRNNESACRRNQNSQLELSFRNITCLSNQKNLKFIPGEEFKNLHSVKYCKRRIYRVVHPREQLQICFPFGTHPERSISFDKWPSSDWWPNELINAGFFSLGDGLKLQCHSCGIRTDLREWSTTDRALDKHASLNPECEFLNSFGYFNSLTTCTHGTKNVKQENARDDVTDSLRFSKDLKILNEVPISHTSKNSCLQPPKGVIFKYQSYSDQDVRMESFNKWSFGKKQNPKALSVSGYFYTGEGDIVRCFCCDLGLAEWDESDDPWTEHARHSPKCWFLLHEKGKDFIEKIQSEWRKIYNPKHAAYDDKLSRMATFEGVWRGDIEQTAEVLADSGFFYEGEEDTVRCHYCDGGLRNWEPGDIPWEEHARWFPFCKFVIKMKGREYIDEIKAKYETAAQKETQEPNTETSIRNGAIVKSILDMGFQMKDIIYAANEYTKHEGNIHYNAEDLLRILIDRHETEKLKQQFGALSIDENQNKEDPEKVREVNKELKKNMMCIRCEKNTKSILFVECGHRVTCETCANDVDFCPYCDVKIKTRLKTYLS